MNVAHCPNCSFELAPGTDSCPSCRSDVAPAAHTPETGSQPTARLRFLPGESFAGRFTIVERIGGGGMGVVYKATDTALDTTAALKLMQPELAGNPAFVERFRREVRITRQITHPNICRVHDIGSHEGVLYLSMEWIEGETLQQLLRQTGAMKEERALEIAEQICLALEAAHDKGIVHRDLKPANVMIDGRGNVSVLDFGLALERGATGWPATSGRSGTPLYMAPEQRRGEALDGRTDQYALGLLLLELLTGRPPVGEPSIPLEVRSEVAEVLRRLLAPNLADRYPSTAAVRHALRQVMQSSQASTLTSAPALPLDTRTRRRRLGLAAGAAVVALSAVLLYAFWPAHPPPAALPLDHEAAEYYLRGTYYLRQRAETVGEIDSATGMLRRALTTEPESALVMAALAEAYWRRYGQNRAAASRDEAQRWLEDAARRDPALAEVRYARALSYGVEGRLDEAAAELRGVVEQKPELAVAWLQLGDVLGSLGNYSAGLSAFQRAMRLEPGNFRMHLYRGLFHDQFQEHEEAARYYAEATVLKPESRSAWNNLAAARMRAGKLEAAIPALLRSLELDEYADARSNLGTAFYLLGRYAEAVEQYRRAAELEPSSAAHWGNLGDTLLVLERGDEARQAYARAAALAEERLALEPRSPTAHRDLALYCAKAGDAPCALEHGGAILALQPENADFLRVNAVIHCLLGQDDEALAHLERAVELGASKAQIEATTEFLRLRDLPRYKGILDLAS